MYKSYYHYKCSSYASMDPKKTLDVLSNCLETFNHIINADVYSTCITEIGC